MNENNKPMTMTANQNKIVTGCESGHDGRLMTCVDMRFVRPHFAVRFLVDRRGVVIAINNQKTGVTLPVFNGKGSEAIIAFTSTVATLEAIQGEHK